MNGDDSPPVPTAIAQDTIHVVLQYISQHLPLPPHLISKPLLQRHYFLQLTPDDYIAYIAWPGSSKDHMAAALSKLASPLTDQRASYHVVYSSDPEAVLSHVAVAAPDASSAYPVRLVFLWDHEAFAWKYHNLAPMPFPSESVSTVDQLMLFFDHSDIDEASYWGNSDSPTEINSRAREENELSDAEDDYWSRYLAVHGSGDSTVPSPSRRKSVAQVTDTYEESDRVMVAYPTVQTEVYNPLMPPSPGQLTRRLAALSTPSNSSFPADDTPSESASPTLSPDQAHSPDPSTIAITSDAKPIFPCIDEHPNDIFLSDAIKSIYLLWKEGRPNAHHDTFMEIVRQSIHTS